MIVLARDAKLSDEDLNAAYIIEPSLSGFYAHLDNHIVATSANHLKNRRNVSHWP